MLFLSTNLFITILKFEKSISNFIRFIYRRFFSQSTYLGEFKDKIRIGFDPDQYFYSEDFLQFNIFGAYLIKSSYIVLDKTIEIKQKIRQLKLDFLNKSNYCFEIRAGYSN